MSPAPVATILKLKRLIQIYEYIFTKETDINSYHLIMECIEILNYLQFFHSLQNLILTAYLKLRLATSPVPQTVISSFCKEQSKPTVKGLCCVTVQVARDEKGGACNL